MPTNTPPKSQDKDSKEIIQEGDKRGRSAASNAKEIVSCKKHEDAIRKRYGKNLIITGTYEMNEDATYREVTLRFQSPKGKHYVLTEYFKDNGTDYVVLYHTVGDRTFEHRFSRPLDAEVSMIDLIAEE